MITHVRDTKKLVLYRQGFFVSVTKAVWGALFLLPPQNSTTKLYILYQNEVEGIDNAPVKIRHLSIGVTAMTVIKLFITNCLNSVHTKK